MTLTIIFLFLAALFAGALNSIAGGGTFFAFPALIFAGLPPVVANATCTVAVWPGAVASAFAYRKELNLHQRKLPLMLLISLAGGAGGAVTLLYTPASTFEFLIPWLLLIATLLFTFGPKITAFLRRYNPSASVEGHITIIGVLLQFSIAFYGGYFGAGIGILMLALLALLGMNEIHEMNALKTVLGSAINGIAVCIFIISGVVDWHYASLMLVGAMIGGYLGAHYARKFEKNLIRNIVIFCASAMTIWFFAKS